MAEIAVRLISAKMKLQCLADAFEMRGSNKTTIDRAIETCGAAAVEIERLQRALDTVQIMFENQTQETYAWAEEAVSEALKK